MNVQDNRILVQSKLTLLIAFTGSLKQIIQQWINAIQFMVGILVQNVMEDLIDVKAITP